MNAVYRKLRNKKKKLDKIKETDDKVKRKEIVPNQEQLEMIASRTAILAEMEEQHAIIKMY